MTNWIVIAIIAGLAAAAMSASIIAPSAISFFLYYLSPVPLFMAGLGWGPLAAGVGGLFGAVVIAVMLGAMPALYFALSCAVAPFVLSRLALINRPADTSGGGEGEASDAGLEWYPEGRLVLWCAGLTIGLVLAGVLAIGTDAESFRTAVAQYVNTAFELLAKQMPDVDKKQLDDMAAAFVVLLPPGAATVWFLVTLFNMWAGSRLLKFANQSLRPWAPFHKLRFPRTAVPALGISVVLAFMPGMIGLAGTVAAAVFLTAFTLLGLAVVHGLTLNSPARPFMLAALYMLLAVMGWVLVLPLCGLGVMDMFLRLRQRGAGSPANDNE